MKIFILFISCFNLGNFVSSFLTCRCKFYEQGIIGCPLPNYLLHHITGINTVKYFAEVNCSFSNVLMTASPEVREDHMKSNVLPGLMLLGARNIPLQKLIFMRKITIYLYALFYR